jgi:hypothetical protein
MPETTHLVTMIKEEKLEILMRNKEDKTSKYEVDKGCKDEADKADKSAHYEPTKYHEDEFDKMVEYAEDDAYKFTEDKADKPFLEDLNTNIQNQTEDLPKHDRNRIEHLEQMFKEPPIVDGIPVHELSRSPKFKSTEMWPYVDLSMTCHNP